MLLGNAALCIWHDIAPGFESEFEEWHTREHMPERVSVPGFLRARRYIDWRRKKHACFTMYEGADLGVFRSPPYLERLNNPTEWSRRMHPVFRNFARGACEVVWSTGHEIGGAIATFRVRQGNDETSATIRAAGPELGSCILALPGITGVHLGVTDASTTSTRTRETELKQSTGEELFDGALLVEGVGYDSLEAVFAKIDQQMRECDMPPEAPAAFHLSYLLSKSERIRSIG